MKLAVLLSCFVGRKIFLQLCLSGVIRDGGAATVAIQCLTQGHFTGHTVIAVMCPSVYGCSNRQPTPKYAITVRYCDNTGCYLQRVPCLHDNKHLPCWSSLKQKCKNSTQLLLLQFGWVLTSLLGTLLLEINNMSKNIVYRLTHLCSLQLASLKPVAL